MSTQSSIRCLVYIAAVVTFTFCTSARAQNIRGDQLTPQQFKALSDDAVIEFEGKNSTAGEFRAKARQQQQEFNSEGAAANKGQKEGDAKKAKFLQDQKAKLDAENAKVMAQLARMRQSGGGVPENIKQEANQLRERSKNASPAEKAQIEQRAGELLRQLQGQGIK